MGSIGRVISRANGGVFAIETPTGDILKWFTIFELESVDPESHRLEEGNYAYITTDRLGSTLEEGTRVQIIKKIEQIDFYEVGVRDLPERYRVTGVEITRMV